MLTPTDDPTKFVTSPIGRCYVAPRFAIWCAAPDLQGSVLWGALEEQTMTEMIAVGRFVHHPTIARRRRGLTDLRAIERADAGVLLEFVSRARARIESGKLSYGMERQGLLVPDGVGGILISGALALAGVDHALRAEHEVEAIVQFIDHPLAAAAHADAMAIVEHMRGPSALLSRLRTQLSHDLRAPTIDRSAATLHMSTRSLQRALHRLDTSFGKELRHVRITTAEALLAQTDLKVETIASQVGLGNASRMSAVLRRELNLTATALRHCKKIAAR